MACKECIEEGVLSDILLAQRAEVMKMCITEFNEKAYEESVKQEFMEKFEDMEKQISLQSEQISLQSEQISLQSEQIAQKDEQIAQLLERIKELEGK